MGNGKDKQVTTIIGPGAHFEGTLTSLEGVRIEGGFKGRVECESILIISTTAKVQAEVVCEDVYVAGELRGNVIGKNVVELTQRGRIIGDITTANLIMEPGAVFEGKCNMNNQSDDQELLSHSPVTQPGTIADAQPTV
jgi:cytoskeletal protein CcmA (bactofilin family)